MSAITAITFTVRNSFFVWQDIDGVEKFSQILSAPLNPNSTVEVKYKVSRNGQLLDESGTYLMGGFVNAMVFSGFKKIPRKSKIGSAYALLVDDLLEGDEVCECTWANVSEEQLWHFATTGRLASS